MMVFLALVAHFIPFRCTHAIDMLFSNLSQSGLTQGNGIAFDEAEVHCKWKTQSGCLGLQECHIDVKEDQLAKLMVAEGFVHGAEVIMRAETFKRCLLHVSNPPFSCVT